MNKVILKIEGMTCSACANGLEKYLNKQEGIQSASVNLVLAQAAIEYDDTLSLEDLDTFVANAGFKSLGVYREESSSDEDSHKLRNLFLFGILLVFIFYISMGHMIGLPTLPFLHPMHNPLFYTLSLFLLTIPFFLYGRDIFVSGVKNALHRMPNMDTLVLLGVGSSFLYSFYGFVQVMLGNGSAVWNLYFESCATIIYFLKIGRYIDGRSKEKTKEALQELVQMTPDYAVLKTPEGEREVTIDEVKKGDILIARAGMKIAVDGVIVRGEAHLEEAFLTGESKPSKREVHDPVMAGSINLDGVIEYRAEKIGIHSTISEIVQLVVEATSTKAPIQRLADTVSGYFVPTIVGIAVVTFLVHLILGSSFSEAFSFFVSVLVVACPCALGLATPLAVVISEGSLAQSGILIKSSTTLENAHKIDTVVFDKTGTLTYGNLKVSKIYHHSAFKEKQLLQILASLEKESSHPIANAFQLYQKENQLTLLPVEKFVNIEGIGIAGSVDNRRYFVGNRKILEKLSLPNPYLQEETHLSQEENSIVYIADEKKVLGLIGVQDVVRKNAKDVVKMLKQQGKEVYMLTGDNRKTAEFIARKIGISKVQADVLPQEKTQFIKKLLEQGKKVMMVGDGVNDAPSLATSSVGVSFHSATDIAGNSSDIILMEDQLEKIPLLLDVSKRTFQIIKQNLFWAFFYNFAMIPIASGAFPFFHIQMNPMVASLSMTLSSFTVLFNSLRLKRSR